MAPILTAKDLTVELRIGRSKATVVDKMSFSLYPGKTLALVGESGCGKTFTALSLLRILPDPPALPPKGEVLFKGRDLLRLSEKQMRKVRGGEIAMIFQDPMSALNPVYTVGNQLMEAIDFHLKLSPREAQSRLISVLEEVGIPAPEQRLREYPHQLSGGMKQRIMIAMALLCEPDILIADEPTTALDVTVQAQVLDLMRHLQREKGTAILLITHDMGVVAEMADEVIVMYASEAIERGDVRALFDNMAHPYTQALFGALPKKGKGKLQAIPGRVPPLGELPEGCHFNPRCPHVMPICRHGKVPNFALKEEGHEALCWLHDPELQEKLKQSQG